MSLYRTMLFTPANDLRKVGKALMLKADGVVLDLEDAVAISEKTRARLALKEALALPRSGDVFIRVNSAQTDYILADLLASVTDGVKGLSPSRIGRKSGRWTGLLVSWKRKGASDRFPGDYPFIESANAIVNAYSIASACKRVSRMFLEA